MRADKVLTDELEVDAVIVTEGLASELPVV